MVNSNKLRLEREYVRERMPIVYQQFDDFRSIWLALIATSNKQPVIHGIVAQNRLGI
jgi:hypothetical protein